MPTDDVTPRTPETAPVGAVDGQQAEPAPDHANAPIGPEQPQNEASMREWLGLPADSPILAPDFATPPLRCPNGVWAMLVVAVNIAIETDRAGEVAVFAGGWIETQPPADDLYDGDLVLRLTPVIDPKYPFDRATTTDVEMLLAHHGSWQRVGQWRGLDVHWPLIIAPTAAAVMGLHRDLSEAVAGVQATLPPTSASSTTCTRGGISEPLDAEMIAEGDEMACNRSNLGMRIRGDGTLVLTDGRVYATPSGAASAVSGHHQNGWATLRRAADGRTLADLRDELTDIRTKTHARMQSL